MKKLMIIDDEMDILDILSRFLSRSGKLEVETYSNPGIALKKAKAGGYDMILSDIMMPQVSGLDILKEVKKTTPNLKVVLMTAYNNKHKEEQSKELMVDNYLEKPFTNLKDVENTILSVLGV